MFQVLFYLCSMSNDLTWAVQFLLIRRCTVQCCITDGAPSNVCITDGAPSNVCITDSAPSNVCSADDDEYGIPLCGPTFHFPKPLTSHLIHQHHCRRSPYPSPLPLPPVASGLGVWNRSSSKARKAEKACANTPKSSPIPVHSENRPLPPVYYGLFPETTSITRIIRIHVHVYAIVQVFSDTLA